MSAYSFAKQCELSHNSIYLYLKGKPICSMAAYKIQKQTGYALLYEFLTDKPKTKKVRYLEKKHKKPMHVLLLPGTPIPELRQRVSFAQRRVYDSQSEIKALTRKAISVQFQQKPLLGPIKLTCYFFMPIPLTSSLKKKREAVEAIQLHTKKPDCDNLIKFVSDQMNGIIYKDDAQVQMSGIKIESPVGYTIMVIKARGQDGYI